jgi:hypothetical protein
MIPRVGCLNTTALNAPPSRGSDAAAEVVDNSLRQQGKPRCYQEDGPWKKSNGMPCGDSHGGGGDVEEMMPVLDLPSGSTFVFEWGRRLLAVSVRFTSARSSPRC